MDEKKVLKPIDEMLADRTLFGQKRSASFKMVFTTNPSFRS
ncbi:hypothetical protein [Levilactobacillus brevis]